jgi:hypothetical protein
METMGIVEVFIGSVEGKAVQCMRLLKEFTGEEEEEAVGGEEEEGEGEEGGSNTLAEQCLDRQMLHLILEAGEQGGRGAGLGQKGQTVVLTAHGR